MYDIGSWSSFVERADSSHVYKNIPDKNPGISARGDDQSVGKLDRRFHILLETPKFKFISSVARRFLLSSYQ